MKKCPHCNGIFSDDFEKCPQCDIVLSNYTSDDKEKDDNEIEKEKIRKLITIGALVAAFILGIGFKSIIGVKETGEIEQITFDLKGLIYFRIAPESVKKYTHIWQAQDKADPEVFEDYKLATSKSKKAFTSRITYEDLGGEDYSDLDW